MSDVPHPLCDEKVLGDLRQGAGRGMVLFHVGNFPSVKNRPVKDVLEELVKDGYFKDRVQVVCPEGHVVRTITRSTALPEDGVERRRCDQWIYRLRLHLQPQYVLADHLHFPSIRAPHVLLAEAEQLLTCAAEVLDAPC